MSTRASLMGPSRWRWGLRGGHEWGVIYKGAGDRGKGLAGVAAERVEHVCRESSPSLRCGSSGRAGDAGVGQDQQVQVSNAAPPAHHGERRFGGVAFCCGHGVTNGVRLVVFVAVDPESSVV